MAIIGEKDLMVNYRYDLVMKSDQDGDADLIYTNRSTANHTLAQVMRLALMTLPGDFASSPSFGASPKGFVGGAVTKSLFGEIERYISLKLEKSGLGEQGLRPQVQTVPVSRTDVALRVKIIHKYTGEVVYKMDMLYSTADNSVTPLTSGYGA